MEQYTKTGYIPYDGDKPPLPDHVMIDVIRVGGAKVPCKPVSHFCWTPRAKVNVEAWRLFVPEGIDRKSYTTGVIDGIRMSVDEGKKVSTPVKGTPYATGSRGFTQKLNEMKSQFAKILKG